MDFWKNVKIVSKEKVRVVLVHMYEKWFSTIKPEEKSKSYLGRGVISGNNNMQHKYHIGKETYIVSTAFV